MNRIFSTGETLLQEQEVLLAKCFHPSGNFVAFKIQEIEQSISACFEQVVRNYPDRIAVKTDSYELTYDALNRYANRIAHGIRRCCGDDHEPVALLFGQGAATICASLGALKARKIDVPLDPVNPDARIHEILKDSGARLVVADNRNESLARKLAGNNLHLLNIDELESSGSDENLGLQISPENPARIIYTSGSTGQAKGVILNHRRILHEVMTNINGCLVGRDDRLALLTSPSTSQGTVITYTALLTGAALCLFSLRDEGLVNLADWLNSTKITVYTSVRAIFRHFVSTLACEQEFPHLRLVALGGDQVRKNDVDLYKRHFASNCLLKIFLSSTETGNMCQYAIDKETEITSEIVPVGYPAEAVEILLLDEDGHEVGFNQIGEIAVRSRYLSPGYWKRQDLTEAKFRTDSEGGEKRIYLTADIGRRRHDGCLEYLGRKDSRVKISGYAVELGEIEAALLEDNRVSEAVVAANESPEHDPLLVAYIVPRTRCRLADGELGRRLRGRLPEYMIPSDFVILEALPLTPMGKIDLQALPASGTAGLKRKQAYVPATTLVEKQVAGVWQNVLKIEKIGVHDNFFDLGGHSLAATRVIAEIVKQFEVSLLVKSLFESPTVAEMARLITEHRATKLSEQELECILKDLESMSNEQAQKCLSELGKTKRRDEA